MARPRFPLNLKKQYITARLPPFLLAWIERQKGVTRTEIIENALVEYLSRIDKDGYFAVKRALGLD